MQFEYHSYRNVQPCMLPADIAAPISMNVLVKRLADDSMPQSFQHLPAPNLTLAHSQFGVFGKEQAPIDLGSLLEPLLGLSFTWLEWLNGLMFFIGIHCMGVCGGFQRNYFATTRNPACTGISVKPSTCTECHDVEHPHNFSREQYST